MDLLHEFNKLNMLDTFFFSFKLIKAHTYKKALYNVYLE